MTRTSLPPGFRFHPTDVELIKYYLKRKVTGGRIRFEVISELDVYKYCPWDLPDKSCWRSKDLEWYFFSPRERKYLNGARMNRSTDNGYWKTTGKDRSIYYNDQSVGMIKTLIFHNGKPPRGERTDWVMHEYRLEDKALADAGIAHDAHVICKIFQKSGPGPKNGAQYGAPFDEKEWSEDEVDCVDSFMLTELSAPPPTLKNNLRSSAATSTFIPGSTICTGSSSSGTTLSHSIRCPDNMILPFQRDDVSISDIPLPLHYDILHSLEDCLPDHITFARGSLEQNENLDKVDHGDLNGTASLDDTSLFEDLGELEKLGDLAQYSMSGGGENCFAKNQMFGCGDCFYLEDPESPLEGPSSINGVKGFTSDTGPLNYDFYNNSESSCLYLEDPESPLEGPSSINGVKCFTSDTGPLNYDFYDSSESSCFYLEDLESPLEGPSSINGVKCFTSDTGPLNYDFYNSSESSCFYLEDLESPLKGPSNIDGLKCITTDTEPPTYTDPVQPGSSISNSQSAFVPDVPDGNCWYEN